MTTYNYATVRGRKMFYREAGSKHAPAIVLLHGFPSSLLSAPAKVVDIILEAKQAVRS